jgi:hypothetical protein
MLIPPRPAAAIVAQGASLWEQGCYLGVAVIVIAAAYFWAHRREPHGRLLAAMFLLTAGAALGPVLHLDHRVIMPLPWAGLEALPLISQALPIRSGNYTFLVLAVVVSLWLEREASRFKKPAIAAVVLGFLPNPAIASHRSSYETPAFFAQRLYRRYLRPNENVLIIPYGRNGPSMAWQAQSWMYFRMPGGHLSTTPEWYRRWPVVNTLETSIPLPDSGAQLQAFAAANQIDAIVVADSARGIERELPASLRIQPLRVGDVSLYRLPPNAKRDPLALRTLQTSAGEAWFSMLLCAAGRFVAKGGNLTDLNPVRARGLGVLPDSKWSDSLGLLFAATPHGASNGLWVGPAENDTVAVGLFVAPRTAEALVSSYRAHAISALYPFPRAYSKNTDESVHFLMINLESSILSLRVCF